MTLPFRRRHNDAEASHDRARALISLGFLEPIEPAEAAWLEAHLAGCLECRTDSAAYEADRLLLRTLRDRSPEPPRDLWARTAAGIERSSGRRDHAATPGRAPRRFRFGRVPLGVMSGLLVVLVVVGASLVPRGQIGLPGKSDVADGTPGSEATPLAVDAQALAWIQTAPDGSYELVQANVNEVCPDTRAGCAPLDTRTTTHLSLIDAPQSVVLSPTQPQMVVVTRAEASSGADIVIVPVPTAEPQPTLSPVPTDLQASGSPATSETPSTTSPTSTPGGGPTGSPEPSASPDVSAGFAIVSGVEVVGDTVYSPDGQWLAFSARLVGGGTGPDLYLWHAGDPLAMAVTTDHRTFFAGWLGDKVLANRVEPGAVEPAASAGPEASIEPTAAPTPAATPTSASAGASTDANGSPAATPAVVEDHPVAFILDPESKAITELSAQDIWHPTVDPTSHTVVYWSGTLVPNGTDTGWTLGTGRLVIDGWLDGSAQPSGSATPAAPNVSATPAPSDPSGSPIPVVVGPAGHPVTIADGPILDFDTWFDPWGLRLAVWIADPADASVGTLRLVVLDPATLQIDPTANPLPGVAALRGVSINSGRLAWVTPPGQDGQGSHVQVVAWNGRDFGQVRTIGAERLLVAR